MKRICFFGDSVPFGLGDDTGQGWVGRLAEMERRAGRPFLAFNLGVPLGTSQSLWTRWRGEAESRLDDLPMAETGLIFNFGLDDMAEVDGGGISVPLPQSMSLAERILSDASALWPCLWVGPPPGGPGEVSVAAAGRRARYRRDRLGALNLAYRRLAEDLRVPYLDLQELMAADPPPVQGVFPTGAGHQKLAEAVRGWLAWRRWFDPAARPPAPERGFQPFTVNRGLLS